MTRSQKLIIIAACVFYVLTIFGFFYLDLPLIIVFFVLFSLSMLTFAYLCFRMHNDYTGAEHLQQEIGVLKAENVQMKTDCDKTVEEKNNEIIRMQLKIDDLSVKLADKEEELNKTLEEAAGAVQEESIVETDVLDSLLPPEDEDPAVTVDIIDVARRAIAELSEQAQAANLQINISTASDKLMVHAGANRLLIMFRNIIDNSIKYMQTAGVLVITISAVEDDIFIVLKDTGKGLPENETKHIFELNYQGSNRISGNGLGLTQAKAIVEHYGGTIYARSPAGGGMGIYIQLPTT